MCPSYLLHLEAIALIIMEMVRVFLYVYVSGEVNAGNVVKYGTLGNDDEFRIIKANQSYELGAMCGFGWCITLLYITICKTTSLSLSVSVSLSVSLSNFFRKL